MELSLHGKNVIKNLKNWSATNYKLSRSINAYISGIEQSEREALHEFSENIGDLNEFYKSEYTQTVRAISAILKHRVIKQIDRFVKDGSEGIDVLYKQRKNIRLDYDSHLQRVSLYQRKKNEAQTSRFQAKALHDKEMLDQFTTFLQSHFEDFISIGSTILMECSAAIVVTQMYLVKKQYDALSEVGNNIGEQFTDMVLTDLSSILEEIQNGNEVEKTFQPALHHFPLHPDEAIPKYITFREYEASSLSQPLLVESFDEMAENREPKDAKRAVGRRRPVSSGEMSTEDERSPWSLTTDYTAEREYETTNDEEEEEEEEEASNDEDEDEDDDVADTTSPLFRTDSLSWREQASGLVEWSSQDDHMSPDRSLFDVIAMYTFKGDEEGDLPFRKGDIISVIAVDECGWWTGKFKGNMGIFPANYVKRL